MRELNDFKDSFRVFETVEDVFVFDRTEAKTLNKGHRFIGFYYGDNKSIGISNTDINLKAKHARELYKVEFNEVSGNEGD